MTFFFIGWTLGAVVALGVNYALHQFDTDDD
jgi:hypothetical protein